jgi:hypothetical protein
MIFPDFTDTIVRLPYTSSHIPEEKLPNFNPHYAIIQNTAEMNYPAASHGISKARQRHASTPWSEVTCVASTASERGWLHRAMLVEGAT